MQGTEDLCQTGRSDTTRNIFKKFINNKSKYMIILTNFKNHLEGNFFKIIVRFLVQKVVLKKKVTATLFPKNQKIKKNINVLTLFFSKGSDHL